MVKLDLNTVREKASAAKVSVEKSIHALAKRAAEELKPLVIQADRVSEAYYELSKKLSEHHLVKSFQKSHSVVKAAAVSAANTAMELPGLVRRAADELSEFNRLFSGFMKDKNEIFISNKTDVDIAILEMYHQSVKNSGGALTKIYGLEADQEGEEIVVGKRSGTLKGMGELVSRLRVELMAALAAFNEMRKDIDRNLKLLEKNLKETTSLHSQNKNWGTQTQDGKDLEKKLGHMIYRFLDVSINLVFKAMFFIHAYRLRKEKQHEFGKYLREELGSETQTPKLKEILDKATQEIEELKVVPTAEQAARELESVPKT